MTYTLYTSAWVNAAVFFLLTFTSHAVAQSTPLIAEQLDSVSYLSSTHGLPSNVIHDIEVGPQGFLWIATAKGLTRYDGTAVKTFSELNIEATNLASIQLLTHANTLWAATNNRLWHLSETGDWSSVAFSEALTTPFNVNTLSKGPANSLLIGTSTGLLTFNSQTEKIQKVPLKYNEQPITDITFIELFGDWFWLSSHTGGIFVWDGYSDNVFSITKKNPIADTINASSIHSIAEFEEAFWLATDKEIKRFNKKLRRIQTPPSINQLKTTVVDIKKHHNALFIATNQGLYHYRNNQLEQLTQSPAKGKIKFAPNGDLFLATSSNGLTQIPTSYAPAVLNHYAKPSVVPGRIQSTLPDSLKPTIHYTQINSHQYWLQSDLGIVLYDFIKKEILTIVEPPVVASRIVDIEAYSDSIFLLTKTHQLHQYSTVKKQWLNQTGFVGG